MEKTSSATECTRCHGSAENAAPPPSPLGARATSELAVGAHQAHLGQTSLRAAPLECDECHVVPDRVDAPGHIDGRAAVTFGALGAANGAGGVWDREARTCSATWCHGGTLAAGGRNTAPTWTAVGEGQAACGACHGNPPPPPHPSNPSCSRCHPLTVHAGGALDAGGGHHIDATVDAPALACNACHGSAENAAPPLAASGAESTTAVAVGAHQAHVRSGAIRAALGCDACHPAPQTMLHADGDVDLSWSALAGDVTWDRSAATCATYCHGATLDAGGTLTLPVWTDVGSGQTACGTCHGDPPPPPHPPNRSCNLCHADTVDAEHRISLTLGRHIDGTVQVSGMTCRSCHGSDANFAPPLSTTGESATTAVAVGAHQAHVRSGAIRAALDCDACHTVPATMLHADGDVDLSWSALAGDVTWSRETATCSTYCHGATLDAGGTVALPVWTEVGSGQTACGTCHGDPPPPPHPQNASCNLCHADTVDAEHRISLTLGRHIDGTVQVSGMTCRSCHGSEANPAPPLSTSGESATTAIAVGAHQSHLRTGAVRTALGCADCHVLPESPAHTNGTVDFAWSPLAGSVTWNRDAATCATYCHGATLAAGGTVTLPVWTEVGTGQTACGTCHAAPPPAPHPPGLACERCHPDTVTAGLALDVAGRRHLNGTVDVTAGCDSCHGSAENPAPPVSTTGESATTAIAVGAHQSHLRDGAIRGALACEACHALPTTVGHADGTVDLVWSALAGDVTWDREAATCATYCHGATLAGGTATLPVWNDVGSGQTACGTCHGNPPPPPHPANPLCNTCHAETVDPQGGIYVLLGRHIDGALQVSGMTCRTCHGSEANPAPPVSTSGESSTTAVAVGAHQSHLRDGAIRAALGCADCHVLPESASHANGAVDLSWSPLAGPVTWDRGAATCATYCHGATLDAGGTVTLPVWNDVGSGQTACGACHGNPPPPPHPANPGCNGCHPDTVDPQGGISVLLGRHIDGALQVSDMTCRSCHGSEANPAPPLSTSGESSTTALAVGAHQPHLRDGAIRAALGCADCHALPVQILHADGTVDLVWSALAGSVTWSREAATCSTYCHGATLDAGGTVTLPVWTDVGSGQTACGACHGNPPPPPHPAKPDCGTCHPDTVGEDGAILVAGGRHIDGYLDSSTKCGDCHGAPPASGAHAAHAAFVDPSVPQYGDLRILEGYAPAGGAAYQFGCGHCHPLEAARHVDGTLDVELSPAAGGAGLRALNAADARYAGAGGACTGVYCHSSGQAAPAFVASPGWTSGLHLGCAGCHGNPPAYASGGAGAPDANGHIGLTDAGREFGHFAGMAGPSHRSRHGGGAWPAGQAAAPITCQTCHYETTDPTTTGSSGFYWLDTGGSYALSGGDPARADDPAWRATQCATCHGEGRPAPAGSGRVLPLRHVNGRRDVAFDSRTALPAYPALPAPPNQPTRPYWLTEARLCEALPPAAILEGTTLSLHLASASWDPAAKTCSGVACHVGDAPVWGRPYRTGPAAPGPSCCRCHASRCP